jgi:hypothetical protein
MLLIGGSGQGINAQTVHLLDLRTGVTCGFKNLPGDVSVNEGEAVFINGKVIACASNGCVTWEENQWTSNEPKHTVSLKEDAAILLPDNRWLLVEHTGSIPPKSAIYDPVNNTFGEGFEFNAKMGGAGYCMTLISNDTIGFISLADKGLYSYKVPKGPIDQVGEMPDVDIGTQGSCRTLIKDGIHMGNHDLWCCLNTLSQAQLFEDYSVCSYTKRQLNIYILCVPMIPQQRAAGPA